MFVFKKAFCMDDQHHYQIIPWGDPRPNFDNLP